MVERATQCPLWVISGQIVLGQNPTLSALVQKRTNAGAVGLSVGAKSVHRVIAKSARHIEPNHLTGCASGNFQLPSMISFRGRYSRTV